MEIENEVKISTKATDKCENDMPNDTTIAAINEGEKLIHDPDARKFKSVEELLEELES